MPRSTFTEKRYAVCIGINHYQPSAKLGTLRYAEGDAQAMYDLLGQLGFAQENRCLLLGQEATLDAINEALSTLILDRPGENDLVVFYFAGHSLPLTINEREVEQGREPRSEVSLATYDFDREKIKQSLAFRKQRALGMERLRKDFFEGEGSRKRLFIFDSCYSGDFYGPTYRADQTTDPVQGYIGHMLESKSTGRVALSSCLPIQKAAEDASLGHGRFTYYLLEALSGRARESLRRDGCLTVNTLFEYLAQQLPDDQRPVLSCVQQDTFELACFPDLVEQAPHQSPPSEKSQQEEREARLQALLSDHSSFMRSRLDSFVGREKELAEIRQLLTTIQSMGGYLTITGQAGQGKSSIIAKLVEIYQREWGSENIVFHFIPFNPGPDHQLNVLRSIIARLLLKYSLPEVYVASESRPILQDYLLKVLLTIEKQGGHEIIFIDGLDQLRTETDGERDLSFLPANLPAGIVFVLGTRPNDTLKPLELLKPHHEYKLPELSRQDFDLILLNRGVQLEADFADQFYQVMQANALYLDLAARGLWENKTINPQEIIARIAHNPENLFSLAMARLKQPATEWREVIKPTLGLLLASREPLGLHALRQILGVEDERLRDGVMRLGGLLTEDGNHQYSLFHLMFYDYLRQDEQSLSKEYVFAADEEEGYHQKFIDWCERKDIATIWYEATHDPDEQTRRAYARQHYITHLYHSKEWQKLFAVLDDGQYGRAKMRHDASLQWYVQDLDLGRQAASWAGWTMQEGFSLLPRLWRYTLLRCSLVSRADQYPEIAFQLLISFGQRTKALGLVELVTDPLRKLTLLLQMAERVKRQEDGELEYAGLIVRAISIVQTLPVTQEKEEILESLVDKLLEAELWEQAERVIDSVKDCWLRAEMSGNLGRKLVEMGQQKRALPTWDHLEQIIKTEVLPLCEDNEHQAETLSWLSKNFIEAGRYIQAERVIEEIENSEERTEAYLALEEKLAETGQWNEANRVVSLIEEKEHQADALVGLGRKLIEAGQEEQAQAVWHQLEALILQDILPACEENERRAEILGWLGKILTEAGQEEQAQAVWHQLEALILQDVLPACAENEQRAEILGWLGKIFTEAGQWERATQIIGMIGDNDEQDKNLGQLATALSEAGQWERAEHVIALIGDRIEREEALDKLTTTLSEAGQWEQAEHIIALIGDRTKREDMLDDLATALSEAGQWKQAEHIITLIDNRTEQENALAELAAALSKAGQWEQVEHLIALISDREKRNDMLDGLATILSEAGQWERAEHMIAWISDQEKRDEMRAELIVHLLEKDQWKYAESTIHLLERGVWRALGLSMLGRKLTKVGQNAQVWAIWGQIEAILQTEMKNISWEDDDCSDMICELWKMLIEMGQMGKAAHFIDSLSGTQEAQVLLVNDLEANGVKAGQRENIPLICQQAIEIVNNASYGWGRSTRMTFLKDCIHILIDMGEWEQVSTLAESIEDYQSRITTLGEVAEKLAETGQWEQAEHIAGLIGERTQRATALSELGGRLMEAGHQERAQAIWLQVEEVVNGVQDADEQASILRGWERILPAEATEFTRRGMQGDQERIPIEDDPFASNPPRLPSSSIRWNPPNPARNRRASPGRGIRPLRRPFPRINPVRDTLRNRRLSPANSRGYAPRRGVSALPRARRQNTSMATRRPVPPPPPPIPRRPYYPLRPYPYASRASVSWRNRLLIPPGKASGALSLSSLRSASTRRHPRQLAPASYAVRPRRTISQSLAEMQEASARITGEDNWLRARAFINLGKVVFKTGNEKQAGLIWAEAEKCITALEGHYWRAKAASELGKVLAEAQYYDQAQKVIEQIGDSFWKSEALSLVVKIVAEAGEWEQAETMLKAITNNYWRAMALSQLEKALIKAGNEELAQALLPQIQETIDAINDLHTQSFFSSDAEEEQIADVWNEDADSDLFEQVDLREAGRFLIDMGQRELGATIWKMQAQTHEIAPHWPQMEAMSDLGRVFSETRQWDQAEKIIARIKSEDILARELIELSKILERNREYERLLRLVQRWWRKAVTRTYAIQLLPLVYVLVPLTAETGFAFCESFSWVDSFLQ